MLPKTIALDGPAGSGKSTTGRVLASRLHYAFVDTGLLYRFIARQALDGLADLTSGDAIVQVAERIGEVRINPSRVAQGMELDRIPITEFNLRDPEIARAVPLVARFEEVRVVVRKVQRRLIADGPTILAGRDIGTVVAPEAELKLYLDVSLSERAARRLWACSEDSLIPQQDMEEQLSERDRIDRERQTAPMRIAEGAVVVATDKMSVDETVTIIIEMCGLGIVSPRSSKC